MPQHFLFLIAQALFQPLDVLIHLPTEQIHFRRIAPAVDQVAGQYGEQMVVGKVNVDEQPELASAFGVMSIPTLLVMKNGKVVNQSMGARPKKDILAML